MAIIFDEISAEVATPRGGEPGERDTASPPAKPAFDAAELLRRELQLAHERQHRLIAD